MVPYGTIVALHGNGTVITVLGKIGLGKNRLRQIDFGKVGLVKPWPKSLVGCHGGFLQKEKPKDNKNILAGRNGRLIESFSSLHTSKMYWNAKLRI